MLSRFVMCCESVNVTNPYQIEHLLPTSLIEEVENLSYPFYHIKSKLQMIMPENRLI